MTYLTITLRDDDGGDRRCRCCVCDLAVELCRLHSHAGKHDSFLDCSILTVIDHVAVCECCLSKPSSSHPSPLRVFFTVPAAGPRKIVRYVRSA